MVFPDHKVKAVTESVGGWVVLSLWKFCINIPLG